MSDDDLVERVARAISEADKRWWDSSDEPKDGLAKTLARAALASIEAAGYVVLRREPPLSLTDVVPDDKKTL